ncbi:hypothetical protein DUNSADRAFT_1927 [Dunaliella salina]|uniref:Encoded protein n=1 Tax=Dunaliella salina TaxID=3046 RepID=A0ABQ7FWU6_DUNSA|nr:hypothetical protein DUNSADRAFT_1927 [Dunaliella salina]|eukprot:KAF5826831.1 hypothetical protein DUNSADRAFT_1927 [Dunaliella salina]
MNCFVLSTRKKVQVLLISGGLSTCCCTQGVSLQGDMNLDGSSMSMTGRQGAARINQLRGNDAICRSSSPILSAVLTCSTTKKTNHITAAQHVSAIMLVLMNPKICKLHCYSPCKPQTFSVPLA